MILVLGGTVEGREIAVSLYENGYNVLLTVVSPHGAAMLPPGTPIEVLVGQLEAEALRQLIYDRQVRVIVDATHPYATVISENALRAAADAGIIYIRFERKQAAAGVDNEQIYRVENYTDAAALAFSLGNTIFLTIGSKNLRPFVAEALRTGKRIAARVLPDPDVIKQCLEMGLRTKDIIAIQGPFSEDMNIAMLKEYAAEVLVTKDSGLRGGTDAKLAAAARLGLPVVLISRPENKASLKDNRILFDAMDQVLAHIKQIFKSAH